MHRGVTFHWRVQILVYPDPTHYHLNIQSMMYLPTVTSHCSHTVYLTGIKLRNSTHDEIILLSLMAGQFFSIDLTWNTHVTIKDSLIRWYHRLHWTKLSHKHDINIKISLLRSGEKNWCKTTLLTSPASVFKQWLPQFLAKWLSAMEYSDTEVVYSITWHASTVIWKSGW